MAVKEQTRPTPEPEQPDAPSTCGANLTGGRGKCKQPAGMGTDHLGVGRCKYHFGSTRAHQVSAAREIVRGSHFYGESVDVRPEEALLLEVRRTAGHVAFLATKIETEDVSPFELQLYQAERGHLAKVCQIALHAGIEERQVRVAERMGSELAAIIGAILQDLALDAKQTANAPEIVRKHLRLIEAA